MAEIFAEIKIKKGCISKKNSIHFAAFGQLKKEEELDILELYLREGECPKTELAIGDEVHLFNGELFLIRKQEGTSIALGIMYQGNGEPRIVDGIPVSSLEEANAIIYALMKRANVTCESLGSFDDHWESGMVVLCKFVSLNGPDENFF